MALYTYGIEGCSFPTCDGEFIKSYFEPKDELQFDSETYGFDAHLVDLMCFQMGDADNQFVIHPSKLWEFKDILERKRLLLHNAKFDLKFLYKYNIFPIEVYDTFLAEAVLYCGIKLHKKGLASVAKERLGIDMDKSVRDNIWKEGLTDRVVQYAGDDVKPLQAIRDHQMIELKEKDLLDALHIENRFVLALAYIEWCGFKLDADKWKEKMEKDNEKKEEARKKLDKWLIDNKIVKFISKQLDMFSPEPSVLISWSSPAQVAKLFKHLGMDISYIEKGEKKESVESTVINKFKKTHPIVGLYLDYKEKEKVVSTYGQSWIDSINPITGRLHTNFTQVLNTARLSSGGKNRNTKEEYKNFQNIPSDKETRACFVAEKGNVLIGCDYSGQEQIVLANFSLDANLLKFYDEGLGDMHSFVASKMYPELEGLTLEEVKNKHKDKRQEAKIGGFCINYGGSAQAIADQLDKTLEVGQRVYDGYFNVFPGLKGYFEKAKQQGLRDGYITFNPITRRKSYVWNYERYLELKKEINNNFWERWKVEKRNYLKNKEIDSSHMGSDRYREMKKKISDFFQIKGEIERNSLNYPIQGTSAEITKLSCVFFYEYIQTRKLHGKVLIVNTIHDENIAECPEEMKDEVAKHLQRAMLKAGDLYCQRVPLKADPEISTYWKK